jgi:adenylate kinase family enzyme
MDYKVTLQLPSPQNFIIIDIPTNIEMAKLNQSVTPKPSIAIEKLTQEQAEEYAEELKQQFINHYYYRLKQKNNESALTCRTSTINAMSFPTLTNFADSSK